LALVCGSPGADHTANPAQQQPEAGCGGYREHVLTVLLTRHGHTDRSEPEQYLGQRLHASLTERGRRDAEALAARIESVPIDRIISSPLGRAVETAQIIAPQTGGTIETDERLTELDYGAWEGLTVEEIDRRFPGERELYEVNPATYQVGGGESGIEVAARVSSLIEELLAWGLDAGAPDRTCVLVGHSSLNRVLLALVMGVPLADYRRRFKQDWANLTVLRWESREEGALLMLSNDEGHSRGLRGATWD
jgi:broad specificity phosphatase PhoE